MALSEFEIRRIKKLVGEFVAFRRPAPHIRDQVDLSFNVLDQGFEVFEIRPRWNNPAELIEVPVAKATYVKTKQVWKLFWMRSDGKWHTYTPCPETHSLEEVLRVIDKDSYACFWG